MEDYLTLNQPQQASNPMLTGLNVLIGIAAVCCIIAISLLILGYGTIRITNLPANATIRLNGHLVPGASLKVHPGTYNIGISSPAIAPYQSTVHVKMLQTTTYTPAFQLRNPSAVISSVVGAVGTNEPVDIDHPMWLDNNTWLVGNLLGAARPPIVVHYDTTQKKWNLVYGLTGATLQDITKLPPDVAAYVKQLETTYAPG